MKVTVIGAGSWGTAVAGIAATNCETTLWARRTALATAINERHENIDYLPGLQLHPNLRATDSIEVACATADVVVMGVPSHGFRSVLESAAPFIRSEVPILSLSKGIEQGTLARMTEVIASVLEGHDSSRIGVLTGPNLAKEIVAGQPAASVIAMADADVADALQNVFMTPTFRVYTNPDVVGCEVAGALKNVIAIASGMADGVGAGDNTRSAVSTRGLAELSRLGVAMGGDEMTFAGLAGMGDLIATCVSPQSRNRHVGEQLGRGRSIDEVIAEMNMVAEGVKAAAVVMELADEFGVDLPICSEVDAVCHHGRSAAEAYRGLLRRETGAERERYTP